MEDNDRTVIVEKTDKEINFHGDLNAWRHILIFNRVLTPSERASVRAYLYATFEGGWLAPSGLSLGRLLAVILGSFLLALALCIWGSP